MPVARSMLVAASSISASAAACGRDVRSLWSRVWLPTKWPASAMRFAQRRVSDGVRGRALEVLADEEERRADAVLVQDAEHRRRRLGEGAVVEGEGDEAAAVARRVRGALGEEPGALGEVVRVEAREGGRGIGQRRGVHRRGGVLQRGRGDELGRGLVRGAGEEARDASGAPAARRRSRPRACEGPASPCRATCRAPRASTGTVARERKDIGRGAMVGAAPRAGPSYGLRPGVPARVHRGRIHQGSLAQRAAKASRTTSSACLPRGEKPHGASCDTSSGSA